MVGRFVEQQRVGRFHQHAGQGHAIALAAAEGFDRLFLIITGEQEGAGNTAEKVRFGLCGNLGQ